MTARFVLAIETSSRRGSVALGVLDVGGVVAHRSYDAGTEQAERLLPEVDALLEQAGGSRKDIGAVAAGRGPGSFTGVRVALSTARALGFLLSAPTYGFSSLEALAASAREPSEIVVPVLDAKRGELYVAAYRRAKPGDAIGQELAAPRLIASSDLATWARSLGDAVSFVGEAAAACGVRVTEGDGLPDACSLLALASVRIRQHMPRGLNDLDPLYIRDADAALPAAPLRSIALDDHGNIDDAR